MKISIVTPCRNAERFIAGTIESVLNQTALLSGEVELEYVIADGASTDRTLAIAESFTGLRIVSKPDASPYEALASVLPSLSGDWIAYLNAGDAYDPHAFATLRAVTARRQVRWITGIGVVVREDGTEVKAVLPFRFRRELILAGQYCRRAPFFLPFLQQESTFWHASLNATIDPRRLASFRLAGDYYLWTRFATVDEPAIVDARLGSFRIHRGQLSEDRGAYQREVRSFCSRLRASDVPFALYDGAVAFAPAAVKRMLNPRIIQ